MELARTTTPSVLLLMLVLEDNEGGRVASSACRGVTVHTASACALQGLSLWVRDPINDPVLVPCVVLLTLSVSDAGVMVDWLDGEFVRVFRL